MIVPRFRLFFWVGVVFLPFPTLAATVSSVALLSWGIVAALVLIAIIDAFRGRRRRHGIGVELPEVVRLSKDREGEIALRIKNDGIKVKRMRIGLAFPKEITSPEPNLIAELPEESASSSLIWPCKPLKQGRYILDKCYLEIVSPLGFWAVRTSVPTRTEIRVYPNLFKERKNLSALFQNSRLGIHAQRQIGKGRDFEQLREYMPGDSYEDIHWKSTAKWGYPVTKVYQIERTQQVYVIMDASRLSARSAVHLRNGGPIEMGKDPLFLTTIMDKFTTAALIMGLAAERQGDLFGLLTFSDRVQGFVRAKNGKHHYDACRDMLYTLQPEIITPDYTEIFTFIMMQIRRRALLVFLTSLDDPVLSESFLRHIELISKRHLVFVNMLKPALARPLFSSSTVESVDDLYRNLGGHLLWTGLLGTQKILKRQGIGFTLLDNEKMCTQLVSQYLNVKQRQLL